MADKKLKVTLIKSTIGAVPKNKKTIEALGLTKLYKTVELPDNAATAGALRKVAPYVKVEDVVIEECTEDKLLDEIYKQLGLERK